MFKIFNKAAFSKAIIGAGLMYAAGNMGMDTLTWGVSLFVGAITAITVGISFKNAPWHEKDQDNSYGAAEGYMHGFGS